MLREMLLEIAALVEFVIALGDVRTLGFLVLDVMLLLLVLFHASEQLLSRKKDFRISATSRVQQRRPPSLLSSLYSQWRQDPR